MMNSIVIFFRFLFAHKWKIILTAVMAVIFLIVLFPLSDLNDLISSQVSKLTGNRIYVQLDQMHLNPLTATVSLEKLYVETPQISSLTSDEVNVTPSLSALIAKKPGGKITAKGFLKGELEISMHPAESGKGGAEKSKIEVSATNINLKDVRNVINLNLPIRGEMSLTSQAIADLNMSEQPELDLNLTISRFELASSSVPIENFGSIQLPEIKLGKIILKGRLSNGKFLIENGKLGTTNDELSGEIKGDLALSFQNINGQVQPIIGGYNLSINLRATSGFKQKASTFLSFLDGYRVDSGSISNYKFKIYASQMGMPPQFAPLR